jgi:DNA repair exonuclease SbcCD ATPase subunit
VVLWKELLDMCDFEPGTPVDMDGLPEVRLGTALKLVLKSLSGGFCELNYHVEDDVVVVSTQEDASLDEQYRLAIAKLEPVERVFSRLQDLRLKKDDVEMSTVQTRARTAAIEHAIVQINAQIDKALKTDPMVAKLEPLLIPLEEQVHALQDRTPEEYMSVLEKLVSIRTRFAEHQMDVIEKSGGAELSRLNKELTQLTIDLAGDQAQLDKLSESLVRVEQELAAVTSLETRVNEIRFAEEALQEAQARVSTIKKQYNALQPPQVTVLGLE